MAPTQVIGKTFESQFLALPAEIRSIIYKNIFEGAKLVLHYRDFPGLWLPGKPIMPPIKGDQLLEKIEDNKGALLRTSDFCRKEAWVTLASCTTLQVEWDEDDRNNVLAAIDPDFLQHVTTIHIAPDTLIRADRTLMPGIRHVVLTYDDGYYDVGVEDIGHFSRCQNCFQGTMNDFYDNFRRTFADWKWKRQQFLKLAQEHRWTIVLELRTHDFANNTKVERTMSEIQFDMSTEESRSGRLILLEGEKVDFDLFNHEERAKLSAFIDKEHPSEW